MRPARRSPLRELFLFLLLAFGVSWLVGVVGLFVIGEVALGLGALGPGIAAFWLTWRTEGNVRSLWRQVTRWRSGWGWIAAAFLLPVAAVAITYFVLMLLNGPGVPPDAPPIVAAAAFFVAAFFFFGGPEEPGWRGYALPRLQSQFTALTSTLLLAGVWALWHAPLWFIPGLFYAEMSFPVYVIQIIGMSVVYTWLYNGTGGSVLLAMVLHASTNSSLQYLPGALLPQIVLAAVWIGAALVVLALFGPDDLAPSRRVDRDAVRNPVAAGAATGLVADRP